MKFVTTFFSENLDLIKHLNCMNEHVHTDSDFETNNHSQYQCIQEPSWPCLHGSRIYNYLCIQWLSPLKLWVRIPLRRGALDTTLCDNVCQWLAAFQWFAPGTPVFSTDKTDRHDITAILLKVALNIITLTQCMLLNSVDKNDAWQR